MIRAATLEHDDLCRLDLIRRWSDGPLAAWLMLNPSKADGEVDDPTSLRVIHFSRAAGAGAAMIVNVYPWRATDPVDMFRALRQGLISPEMLSDNAGAIARVSAMASIHFAAFGVNGNVHAFHMDRALRHFSPLDRPLLCLGTSPAGWPLHPLARGKFAIPNDRQPQQWTRP